LKLMFDMF